MAVLVSPKYDVFKMGGRDVALNAMQVADIVGKDISMVLFPDINGRALRELFNDTDYLLINYLHEPMMGHWCCLVLDSAKKRYMYFNPSGNFIDGMVGDIPNWFADQDYPFLLSRLKIAAEEDGYEIHWMDKKMQNDNTMSCGRWCGLFMNLGLDPDSFIKLASPSLMLNNKLLIDITDALVIFNLKKKFGIKNMNKVELKLKELEEAIKEMKVSEGKGGELCLGEAGSEPIKASLKSGPLPAERLQTFEDKGRKKNKSVLTPVDRRAGLDVFHTFVEKINSEPFMVSPRRGSRRKIQSLLYEYMKDLSDSGFDDFNTFVKLLNEHFANKPKAVSYQSIKDLINERRKSFWMDGEKALSRK